MSSSGAASSSARSAAESDSCCRAREMRREAGLGRLHGRVDVGVEGVFELGHRVAHRLGEGHVEVEQEQGARAGGRRRAGRRRGQLAGGRGRVPGRDHGDGAGRGAGRRRGGGPWRSIAPAGPRSRTAKGEESPKRCAGERFAAGRGGAGDRQRGRAQVVLDAEADQAEDGDQDQGGGEGRDGAAARRPGLRGWAAIAPASAAGWRAGAPSARRARARTCLLIASRAVSLIAPCSSRFGSMKAQGNRKGKRRFLEVAPTR